MEILVLESVKREVAGKKVASLRREEIIPGIVYGQEIKPEQVQVEYRNFEKLYRKAGESTLVDLKVDGKPAGKVLIYDIMRDPVSDRIIHVDFYRINLKKHITTGVKVVVEGIAPAVKDFGGILIQPMEELEIKCLPTDLAHEIKVDVSKLANLGDALHVKDLVVPASWEILIDPNVVVVQVVAPKAEEVAPTPAVAAVPAEGETVPVAEEGKDSKEGKEEEKKNS